MVAVGAGEANGVQSVALQRKLAGQLGGKRRRADSRSERATRAIAPAVKRAKKRSGANDPHSFVPACTLGEIGRPKGKGRPRLGS